MNEAKLGPLLILVATMLPVLGALLVFSTLLWGGPNEAAALAVNRYVATDGNDVGSCSDSASPCRTVQYAVDQAASGDSVLVATGVYTDVRSRGGINQTVYLSKSLTLRGGYAEVDWLVSNPISFPTTLDALGRGRVIAILGNITTTIENLIVTGGNANGQLGFPLNPSAGNDVGAGIYANGAAVTISNTTITANSISSSRDGKGVGAFVYQGSASLISNTISNNRQYLGGEGGGLVLWESQATLVHNTISGNRSDYTDGSSTSG